MTTYRIDSVTFTLSVYQNFSRWTINCSYQPGPGDPLPELLLQRWREVEAERDRQLAALGQVDSPLG